MKYSFLLLLLPQFLKTTAQAPRQFEINASGIDKAVYSNHLKLGGTNSNGDRIAVNNYYISINDKPVIPVTGEFHFSRYPAPYVDEQVCPDDYDLNSGPH